MRPAPFQDWRALPPAQHQCSAEQFLMFCRRPPFVRGAWCYYSRQFELKSGRRLHHVLLILITKIIEWLGAFMENWILQIEGSDFPEIYIIFKVLQLVVVFTIVELIIQLLLWTASAKNVTTWRKATIPASMFGSVRNFWKANTVTKCVQTSFSSTSNA